MNSGCRYFALPLVVLTSAASAASEVSIRSLLLEMPDLERLAHVSKPAYTMAQASSYDRAAKSPTENWFANADWGQFLRVERRQGHNEYVMADLKGPGAVMRIWSANPAGTLRIYVDGQELPELIIPFSDLLGSKNPDFPPPFTGVHGQGWNCYYPIPYQNSLKITLDDVGGDPRRVYYHVGYRTYEPGVVVRSFSLAAVKDASKVAEKAAAKLLDPKPVSSIKQQVTNEEQTLQPGGIVSVRTPEGAGFISQLLVRANAEDVSEQPEDLLRSIQFEADFDDEHCIDAPLGDFFGFAPGFRASASLPMSSFAETGFLESRWVMPQSETGRMFFINRGTHPVQLNLQITWIPRAWTPDTMHFKAKWRRETLKTRPFRDWTLLDAAGTGRYVGTTLCVANPVSAWWGEGDEKVYVNGETFPSTFGTGSEDYFGYAWSSSQLFQQPYHNQLRCDGPGNRGYTCVSRYQISDDIPFTTSLRFDLEIWHWADVLADFADVAFWYQLPGGSDTFQAPNAASFAIFPLPEIPHIKGAIEGESLKLISSTGGQIENQTLDERWSGAAQVWWHDPSPGDKAIWEIPSAKLGAMRLKGQFCIARDYGIVQLYWNGQKLGSPVDFYSDSLSVRLIDFGEVEVRERNELQAEIVGSNNSAIKKHMFAIDYLLLGDGGSRMPQAALGRLMQRR